MSEAARVTLIAMGMIAAMTVGGLWAGRPQVVEMKPGQVCIVPYDGPVECKDTTP